MKTYIVNGKTYRAHNKEALARRLFSTMNRWGEMRVKDMAKKMKLIEIAKGAK